MTTPKAFNSGEPVALTQQQSGLVTLVEGTTFCICTGNGDIETGTAQGLFFRDARVISRWQLRVDGQVPQPLSVVEGDDDAIGFVSRRAPAAGAADSTLMAVRRRWIGEGMRERITLENLGREATFAHVELHIGADFADLFAVKEGRESPGDAISSSNGIGLLISSRDGNRGCLVHSSPTARIGLGGLSWSAMIGPRAKWEVELLVQPIIGERQFEPRFADSGASHGGLKSPWLSEVTTIKTHHPDLGRVLRQTVHDLDDLRMEDSEHPEQIFMAAGAPWFMTLFGRDSLLTAWMTLPLDPGIALGTLRTLAALQGRRVDPTTDEEPGRILHESRLGPNSVAALGGTHYYGTIDATPLFVALLAEAWRWGVPEQHIRSLLPAADQALSWMDRHGDRDGDGFLEYQRATDRGLFNQGWKDSWDGINDADGRLGEPPIALAEVQGYAYAAWTARAELAEAFGETDLAATCRDRAVKLRDRFAEAFWLPDEGYLAVALDRRKRPLNALTSNAAQCLWSGIVTDEHAATLVKRLGQADMDSGFGLRTLSAKMAAYNPMSYHNGSVWPHDTALGVAGLMRYAHVPGAIDLAHRLAQGLLRAATAFGGRLPELYCGFAAKAYRRPVPYPTSCSPQAWASAAPLLLVRSFLGLQPHAPSRSLRIRPHLPPTWGQVSLERMRVAGQLIRVSASGDSVIAADVPPEWRVED